VDGQLVAARRFICAQSRDSRVCCTASVFPGAAMNNQHSELSASYDRVAEEFVEEFFKELERKPFDRELLGRCAESVGAGADACDIGCGPGQIARFLQDRGLSMRGIDLSEEMIRCARRLNTDIPFESGDIVGARLAGQLFGGSRLFLCGHSSRAKRCNARSAGEVSSS